MKVAMRCGSRASCAFVPTNHRKKRIRLIASEKSLRSKTADCRRHNGTLTRSRFQELVAVMMVMLFALPHGYDAAMRHFTLHVSELDRSVVDPEMMVQMLFYVA